MSLTPFEWPQSYLDEVRRVFEPRYGKNFPTKEYLISLKLFQSMPVYAMTHGKREL